jgi:hypothetical protein
MLRLPQSFTTLTSIRINRRLNSRRRFCAVLIAGRRHIEPYYVLQMMAWSPH